MTKPVIVTRASKGAPLTRNELDANFSNLDNATWNVSDGTNTKEFSLNDTLTFVAGTNISLSVNSSTGAVTINSSSGGSSGISSVSQDTNPTLGGNLNMSGYKIYNSYFEMIDNGMNSTVDIKATSSHGLNFVSNPSYSGQKLVFDGQYWPKAPGSNGQVLTTDAYGNLSWTTPSSGSSGISSVSQDTNPTLGGNLNMSNRTIYGAAGIIDDGNTNPFQMQIRAQSGKNLSIKKGDGYNLFLNDQCWPANNGPDGTFLKTDAYGNLSWAAAGGISSVQSDTNPQLGGNLNIGNYAVGANHGEITTYGYNFLVQAKSGYNLSLKKGAGNNLFLNDQTWPASGGTSGQVLTTDGSGNCTWSTPSGASPAGSDRYIQYNNNGSLGASSGLQYDGVSLKVNGNLESVYSNGDEGGEIYLNKAQTNTTLAAGVTIDIYQNKLRMFENGGTNRGVYIDMSTASTGVGTNLLSGSGNNIVMLSADRIQIPTTSRTDDGFQVNAWTLLSSGGISGVSVNGSNGRFTLPAGTWVMEIPMLSAQYNQDWSFYDITNSQEVYYLSNAFTMNSRATRYSQTITFTTSGSTTLTFANQVGATSNVNYWYQCYNAGYGSSLSASNKTLIKITKVS